jgi:diphthine-ammonia ligase
MGKIIASVSGGKDSLYALYSALQKGIKVDYLLFIKAGGKAHRLNRWLIKLVSESVGIPALEVDKDIPKIQKFLKKMDTETLISGVVGTSEHIDWYREICDPINVKHYAPLWGKNLSGSLVEMKELGFRILIVELDASMGFKKSWLGKELDDKILQEIFRLEKEQKINPSGEHGEYHTFVLDCPVYKKKIEITDCKAMWEGNKGYFVIKKANLQPKTMT